jgi:hypothetical protein
MISTRTKLSRRPPRPPHGGEASRDVRHDPAGLSARLRELAARAHRAVRAAQAGGPTDHSQRELVELHARIVQLQRSLQAQALDGLLPYVSALRQEVEALVINPSSPVT